MFNLWNLFRHSDGSFEFDVTRAETFRLDRADEIWVRAALASLGVSLQSFESRLSRGRAFYYSSYPEDNEWRDRWPECWVVQVHPDGGSPAHANALSEEPMFLRDLDSGDDSHEEAFQRAVLVVSDHRGAADATEAKARELIAAAGLPATATIDLTLRSYGTGVHQVRVRASGLDLPAQLPPLERLVADLRTAGGAVNWRERLDWPQPMEFTEEMLDWKKRMDQMWRKPPGGKE